MPVKPTYPGVYIEEIPSGVRTIVGVSTSVTAFVGYFLRGPMDEAVQLFNFGDFERVYGDLHRDSEASYAIKQFFLNGGSEAWVIRTAKVDQMTPANNAASAAIKINEPSAGAGVLLAKAANEGKWGDNVRIEVDYATTEPTKTFNLSVTEYSTAGGKQQPVRTETFRNLIIDKNKSNDVLKVVNDGSKLIKLELVGSPSSTVRPAQTGTVSKMFTKAEVAALFSGATALVATDDMTVSLDGTPFLSNVDLDGLPTTATLEWVANKIQAEIRDLDTQLEKVSVSVVGSEATRVFLIVKSGTSDDSHVLSFTGNLATKLGLNDVKNQNVQKYALGGAAKAFQALPNSSVQGGKNGNLPDAKAIIGSQNDKTGLYALEDVDIFNILCIPITTNLSDSEAAQVSTKAIEYCEERRAFYILDVPHKDKTRDEVPEIKTWLNQNAGLRHKNAALYYPRPMIADPLNEYRMRLVAPSGTIAGLYARTDAERGVWKAPAGTDAGLRGVQKLEYLLTDAENGTLNPLAINCLRNLPVYGRICWGARTLDGSDQQASEWKYIPVRRVALFLEETLYRNLKWVVFEPNDEPLWAQIRLNVGAFMHSLFRQGAFQGTKPKDAYFVKCDSETTTQNDINLGIVNIIVGFAPLKPAEFVIIKIQQIAGQIET
ncbi:MAG: phage tail protein [Anaerolineales bacterium]|nr:phage tail protein [Anaerolineales bacterium]